jgi:hypothetical protein
MQREKKPQLKVKQKVLNILFPISLHITLHTWLDLPHVIAGRTLEVILCLAGIVKIPGTAFFI